MCSDSDEEKATKAAAAELADAKCNMELSCIGNKLTTTAGIYCVAPVERLAKNSVQWTDGALEPKFSRFRWSDASQRSVTMVGDKAQFQNGFGAYINVVYECDINVETRKVEDVRVREGRF